MGKRRVALLKKTGVTQVPLEGAKAGVQIGATHSLSEPGTSALALGFSSNIITRVGTAASEEPRATQETREGEGWLSAAALTQSYYLKQHTQNRVRYLALGNRNLCVSGRFNRSE